MSISILNNISALTAENNLNITQAALQKTLTQLSSGSKINSGSDDAAGLSIANGLTASITALTQSSQNATNGTGLLQTADGALSEVTTLLNRAVTLATEASTSGLTTAQATALNNEFTSIQNEITNIGSTTTFNGSAVFGSTTDTNTVVSNNDALGAAGSDVLSTGGTLTVKAGSSTTTFTSTVGQTAAQFAAAINTQTSTTGIQASINSKNQLQLTDMMKRGDISVASSTLTDSTKGAVNDNVISTVFTAGTAGTFGITTGGTLHNIAITATDTAATATAKINAANIGVTAVNNAGTVTITDNLNHGDIATTATAGFAAGVLAAGTTAVTSFSNNALTNLNNVQGTAAVTAATPLAGTTTNELVIDAGTKAYTFTTTPTETVASLINNINSSGDGLYASLNTATGLFNVTDTNGNNNIKIDTANTDAGLQTTLGLAAATNPTASASNQLSVFLSDSSAQGTSNVSVSLGALSAANLGGTTGIATNDLLTTTDAQAALTAINTAISNIAAQRGTIGAGVNQLAAASNVMSNEVTNLTSAESGITDADIGTTVANMSKDTTLQQTGIAALQQANQASQAVLKLLQ
jgi:flagellin